MPTIWIEVSDSSRNSHANTAAATGAVSSATEEKLVGRWARPQTIRPWPRPWEMTPSAIISPQPCAVAGISE